MPDGAPDVLCRLNQLSQAESVTILRAGRRSHVLIMAPLPHQSTDPEESQTGKKGRWELTRKSVECRDRQHGWRAWRIT